MKIGFWQLTPIALLLSSALSHAETLEQVCELKVDSNQCPSVEYYLNKPFEAKDEFEKYKLCSEATFDLYKVQKNCEFDQYLAQAQKSFDKYKNKVSQVWDSPKFSDKHSWVSYTPSLEMKREVNFEKNVIKVTTIEGETTSIEELKEAIIQTSTLTIGDAQKNDVFTAELLKSTDVKELSGEPLLPLSNDKKEQEIEIKQAIAQVTITESTDSKGNKVIEAEIPFPSSWLNRKEKRFFESVTTYANKYDLEPEFVLSIIKTESAFDPRATSHIPAFGLMQIVPSSAGLDATSFLYGEQQMLNRDYLFDPAKNIEVGTAYIHLLRSRYFRGIENSENLKYCVIAAYNGGMAPIYRIFGNGSRKKAISKINQLSPQQVYDTIQRKHSAAETRNYLKKVHNTELKYEQKMI